MLGKLFYLVTILAVGGATATGLKSWLLDGEATLHGWNLWLHLGVAPVFILGLLGLVIFWANACRFGCQPAEGEACDAEGGKCMSSQKFFFWLVAILGFVTMASILICMLPLFESSGQYAFIAVHRYAALSLVIAMVLHLCCMIKDACC